MTLCRWLKESYKEEWPIMFNNLVSNGISMGTAASVSEYASQHVNSDAIISAIATTTDTITFWSTLIGQLYWRDRKKVGNKVSEYLALFSIIELSYVPLRYVTQYYLQHEGWDPTSASLASQGVLISFYTVALPPIRYGLNKFTNVL